MEKCKRILFCVHFTMTHLWGPLPSQFLFKMLSFGLKQNNIVRCDFTSMSKYLYIEYFTLKQDVAVRQTSYSRYIDTWVVAALFSEGCLWTIINLCTLSDVSKHQSIMYNLVQTSFATFVTQTMNGQIVHNFWTAQFIAGNRRFQTEWTMQRSH